MNRSLPAADNRPPPLFTGRSGVQDRSPAPFNGPDNGSDPLLARGDSGQLSPGAVPLNPLPSFPSTKNLLVRKGSGLSQPLTPFVSPSEVPFLLQRAARIDEEELNRLERARLRRQELQDRKRNHIISCVLITNAMLAIVALAFSAFFMYLYTNGTYSSNVTVSGHVSAGTLDVSGPIRSNGLSSSGSVTATGSLNVAAAPSSSKATLGLSSAVSFSGGTDGSFVLSSAGSPILGYSPSSQNVTVGAAMSVSGSLSVAGQIGSSDGLLSISAGVLGASSAMVTSSLSFRNGVFEILQNGKSVFRIDENVTIAPSEATILETTSLISDEFSTGSMQMAGNAITSLLQLDLVLTSNGSVRIQSGAGTPIYMLSDVNFSGSSAKNLNDVYLSSLVPTDGQSIGVDTPIVTFTSRAQNMTFSGSSFSLRQLDASDGTSSVGAPGLGASSGGALVVQAGAGGAGGRGTVGGSGGNGGSVSIVAGDAGDGGSATLTCGMGGNGGDVIIQSGRPGWWDMSGSCSPGTNGTAGKVRIQSSGPRADTELAFSSFSSSVASARRNVISFSDLSGVGLEIPFALLSDSVNGLFSLVGGSSQATIMQASFFGNVSFPTRAVYAPYFISGTDASGIRVRGLDNIIDMNPMFSIQATSQQLVLGGLIAVNVNGKITLSAATVTVGSTFTFANATLSLLSSTGPSIALGTSTPMSAISYVPSSNALTLQSGTSVLQLASSGAVNITGSSVQIVASSTDVLNVLTIVSSASPFADSLVLSSSSGSSSITNLNQTLLIDFKARIISSNSGLHLRVSSGAGLYLSAPSGVVVDQSSLTINMTVQGDALVIDFGKGTVASPSGLLSFLSPAAFGANVSFSNAVIFSASNGMYIDGSNNRFWGALSLIDFSSDLVLQALSPRSVILRALSGSAVVNAVGGLEFSVLSGGMAKVVGPTCVFDMTPVDPTFSFSGGSTKLSIGILNLYHTAGNIQTSNLEVDFQGTKIYSATSALTLSSAASSVSVDAAAGLSFASTSPQKTLSAVGYGLVLDFAGVSLATSNASDTLKVMSAGSLKVSTYSGGLVDNMQLFMDSSKAYVRSASFGFVLDTSVGSQVSWSLGPYPLAEQATGYFTVQVSATQTVLQLASPSLARNLVLENDQNPSGGYVVLQAQAGVYMGNPTSAGAGSAASREITGPALSVDFGTATVYGPTGVLTLKGQSGVTIGMASSGALLSFASADNGATIAVRAVSSLTLDIRPASLSNVTGTAGALKLGGGDVGGAFPGSNGGNVIIQGGAGYSGGSVSVLGGSSLGGGAYGNVYIGNTNQQVDIAGKLISLSNVLYQWMSPCTATNLASVQTSLNQTVSTSSYLVGLCFDSVNNYVRVTTIVGPCPGATGCSI